MLPVFLQRVFLFFLLFLHLKLHANIISFNILGENKVDVASATKKAISFLRQMQQHKIDCTKSVQCRAYAPLYFYSEVDHSVKQELEALLHAKVIYFDSEQCADRSVGQEVSELEQVSALLWSMQRTLSSSQSQSQSHMLSLAFSADTAPVCTSKLMQLFHHMSHHHTELMLLDKTRQLGSISDWRDLMVVAAALDNESVNQWMATLEDVYKHHACRDAYTLLKPRPAILEAVGRHRDGLRIEYFGRDDVCVVPMDMEKFKHYRPHSNTRRHRRRLEESFGGGRSVNKPLGGDPTFCEGDQTASVSAWLRVDCSGHEVSALHSCVTLQVPQLWKNRAGAPIEADEDVNFQQGYTVDRYRLATSKDRPRDFCWHTGDRVWERPSESLVYQSTAEASPSPFRPKTSSPPGRSMNITIVSGSGAHSRSMESLMYMAFSRMYYAHRHASYSYRHALSNQYTPHFGLFFLHTVPDTDFYCVNLFAKALMLLDQMHADPSAEWVLFLDDDVYFNPRFSDLPLELYLVDVPEDKLVVFSNFRSAFTNTFFVRNNEAGRQLMRDWLGVIDSGYVQCHGWDQAAMETLILSRMKDGLFPKTATPFNHTCMNSRWSLNSTLSERVSREQLEDLARSPPEWDWGCDGQSSWSCDFRYENSLTRLGFRSNSFRFWKQVSSFSKGCANEQMPYFHTTFETADRPRLQCALCGDLDRVGSGEFTYDGPLGAGNDVVRRDAVNGWLVNHKALGLFFSSFLDPKNCRRDDSFIPKCDPETVTLFLRCVTKDSTEKDFKAYQSNGVKRIKSMVDGYAYDFEKQSFCYGGEELYAYQQKVTYMKHYAEDIESTSKLSEEEYRKRREEVLFPLPPIVASSDRKAEKMLFEEPDFCGFCREVYREEFTNSRKGDNMVLDCRTKK